MKLKHFPDPYEIYDIDGIALMSDEMSVDILKEAYTNGIFPWPHDDLPVLWFCPQQRGILDFRDLHIPKSLIKNLKKESWNFTINKAFPEVMENCAKQIRPDQAGTWITEYIKKHYINFHNAGFVHSFECWENGNLIGGMYGVFIDGNFSGESMFFKKSNASKACLLYVIKTLKDTGVNWMDIQMVTEHMKRFGGKEIEKNKFLDLKKNTSSGKLIEPKNINLINLLLSFKS